MANLYATTLRPAGGGGVPPSVRFTYVNAPWDGRLYYGIDGIAVPTGAYRYGVVATDRPLTAEELDHFDIVAVKIHFDLIEVK
jgi:hypothetical protein